MRGEAARAGGSGIVGCGRSVNNFIEGVRRAEFVVTGTTIRKPPGGPQAPAPTFTLGRLGF